MLAANSNLRQTIIVEGTDAMVRLLRVSEEEEVLKQVLEIITKLARESADDERELMCLDEPVEAAQAIAANAGEPRATRNGGGRSDSSGN